MAAQLKREHNLALYVLAYMEPDVDETGLPFEPNSERVKKQRQITVL